MNRRVSGFSLVELLVVLAISLFLLAAIYFGYSYLFRNYLTGTGRTAVTISTVVGEEILNQDVEHAGFGISLYEPKPPVEFKLDSNGKPMLTIRSTYVVTNRSTKGWAILDCSSGSSPSPVSYSSWPLPSNYAVLMDFSEKVISPYAQLSSFVCPVSDYLLAYPVPEITLNSGETFICADQACAQIDYYLYKSSAVNPACKDLYVLGRRVSWKLKNGSPSGSVQPFLSCVADFQIRVDWGNRKYVNPLDPSDPDYSAIQNATFQDLKNNLKMIHLYLLIREGGEDPNYVFNGSTRIEPDNVELQLPPDYKHYHWKVVKLSIEPVNIIRK